MFPGFQDSYLSPHGTHHKTECKERTQRSLRVHLWQSNTVEIKHDVSLQDPSSLPSLCELVIVFSHKRISLYFFFLFAL